MHPVKYVRDLPKFVLFVIQFHTRNMPRLRCPQVHIEYYNFNDLECVAATDKKSVGQLTSALIEKLYVPVISKQYIVT